MNNRNLWIGPSAFVIGILLIILGVPYLNIFGIFLFLGGVLSPVLLLIANGQSETSSVTKKIDDEILDFGSSPKIIQTSILLGSYLKKAAEGDVLASSSIIELSKNPDPEIRIISSAKGLIYIKKHFPEATERLIEMETNDPAPEVREIVKSILASS